MSKKLVNKKIAQKEQNGLEIGNWIKIRIWQTQTIMAISVCNLSTKEHKSKSAAITQTGNRVQNLAGVRNETKSSESKFGKAQVSIC